MSLPAKTKHPDNAVGKQSVSARVTKLSETLRERLLIQLLNENLTVAAVQACLEILKDPEHPDRAKMVTEVLKQLPGPSPAVPAGANNTVAIQIVGGLRRG